METDQRADVSDIDVSDVPASRIHGFWEARRRLVLGALGIVIVLGAWELSADLKWVDPFLSSKPTAIVTAAKDYYGSGGGLTALKVSSQEFISGFLVALVVGLLAGLAIGWWRWLDELTDPLVNIAYALPRIALVPLFVAWFGIGLESKIVIVFLSAVFPILLNTITGVKTADAGLLRLARSYGASNRQIFRTVVLPGAMPQITTGIRLGIGLGLVGMIVGELVASTQGLGFTIQSAGGNFQMATMYVAVFTVGPAGMILTSLLRIVERRLDRWRPDVNS
jgi:ABC-type nitrate/sulfonate/bicarbonate transport system permease component